MTKLRLARSAALLLAGCIHLQPLPAALPEPAQGAAKASMSPVVLMEDIRNFSAAMIEIEKGAEPAAALARLYIAPASPGLRTFMQRRNMTAETLAKLVAARPKFYASLGRLWSRPERPLRAISAAIAGLQKLYPDTRLLPIYLFVGDFSAGGLADPVGALISVEVLAAEPGADLSEFGSRGRPARTLDEAGYLAVHEMVHIQQALAQGVETYRRLFDGSGTVLQFAIREGSADFLAKLAAGGHTQRAAHLYGSEHERELWLAFQEDMSKTDTRDWFFGSPRKPGRPPELGYFMGYKIAEAYYRNSKDKPQAIRDILGVNDYEAFLRKSGYANKFRR